MWSFTTIAEGCVDVSTIHALALNVGRRHENIRMQEDLLWHTLLKLVPSMKPQQAKMHFAEIEAMRHRAYFPVLPPCGPMPLHDTVLYTMLQDQSRTDPDGALYHAIHQHWRIQAPYGLVCAD